MVGRLVAGVVAAGDLGSMFTSPCWGPGDSALPVGQFGAWKGVC